MEDKEIKCKDCGDTFVHSIRDQEFYKEQGFQSEPKRCRLCRKLRKEGVTGKEDNFHGKKKTY